MATHTASTAPTRAALDSGRLLTGMVQRVPYIHSALLLSSDGLARAAHGLDADGADHLAALASGLCALGRSTSARFGGAATVRQIIVELDAALFFVTAAGSGTCLAVLAGPGIDPALLGYEMADLVETVRAWLPIPPRQDAAHPAAAPS